MKNDKEQEEIRQRLHDKEQEEIHQRLLRCIESAKEQDNEE